MTLLLADAAFAQAPTSGPGPAAANPGTPSGVVTSGRSYALESMLVVALLGGALFAVCRSSRRN
jgi:hypothetical protein